MAITAAPDVEPTLRSGAGAPMVALEVISGDDALALTRALRASVPDIEKLSPPDEPTIVDTVFPVPGGCLLLADIAGTADDAARVPGIIARHLEAGRRPRPVS